MTFFHEIQKEEMNEQCKARCMIYCNECWADKDKLLRAMRLMITDKWDKGAWNWIGKQ